MTASVLSTSIETLRTQIVLFRRVTSFAPYRLWVVVTDEWRSGAARLDQLDHAAWPAFTVYPVQSPSHTISPSLSLSFSLFLYLLLVSVRCDRKWYKLVQTTDRDRRYAITCQQLTHRVEQRWTASTTQRPSVQLSTVVTAIGRESVGGKATDV